MRGLQAAIAVLIEPPRGMSSEQMLADRARMRVEDNARRNAQGILHLPASDIG